MRQPVQRKGHALTCQARKHRGLTGIERARVAGRPPLLPTGGIVVEIAMARVRARAIVICNTIDRHERLVTYPRQYGKQVGHARRRHDLVEALEALATEALRVVPSAVVGKLVDAHEKAGRSIGA